MMPLHTTLSGGPPTLGLLPTNRMGGLGLFPPSFYSPVAGAGPAGTPFWSVRKRRDSEPSRDPSPQVSPTHTEKPTPAPPSHTGRAAAPSVSITSPLEAQTPSSHDDGATNSSGMSPMGSPKTSAGVPLVGSGIMEALNSAALDDPTHVPNADGAPWALSPALRQSEPEDSAPRSPAGSVRSVSSINSALSAHTPFLLNGWLYPATLTRQQQAVVRSTPPELLAQLPNVPRTFIDDAAPDGPVSPEDYAKLLGGEMRFQDVLLTSPYATPKVTPKLAPHPEATPKAEPRSVGFALGEPALAADSDAGASSVATPNPSAASGRKLPNPLSSSLLDWSMASAQGVPFVSPCKSEPAMRCASMAVPTPGRDGGKHVRSSSADVASWLADRQVQAAVAASERGVRALNVDMLNSPPSSKHDSWYISSRPLEGGDASRGVTPLSLRAVPATARVAHGARGRGFSAGRNPHGRSMSLGAATDVCLPGSPPAATPTLRGIGVASSAGSSAAGVRRRGSGDTLQTVAATLTPPSPAPPGTHDDTSMRTVATTTCDLEETPEKKKKPARRGGKAKKAMKKAARAAAWQAVNAAAETDVSTAPPSTAAPPSPTEVGRGVHAEPYAENPPAPPPIPIPSAIVLTPYLQPTPSMDALPMEGAVTRTTTTISTARSELTPLYQGQPSFGSGQTFPPPLDHSNSSYPHLSQTSLCNTFPMSETPPMAVPGQHDGAHTTMSSVPLAHVLHAQAQAALAAEAVRTQGYPADGSGAPASTSTTGRMSMSLGSENFQSDMSAKGTTLRRRRQRKKAQQVTTEWVWSAEEAQTYPNGIFSLNGYQSRVPFCSCGRPTPRADAAFAAGAPPGSVFCDCCSGMAARPPMSFANVTSPLTLGSSRDPSRECLREGSELSASGTVSRGSGAGSDRLGPDVWAGLLSPSTQPQPPVVPLQPPYPPPAPPGPPRGHGYKQSSGSLDSQPYSGFYPPSPPDLATESNISADTHETPTWEASHYTNSSETFQTGVTSATLAPERAPPAAHKPQVPTARAFVWGGYLYPPYLNRQQRRRVVVCNKGGDVTREFLDASVPNGTVSESEYALLMAKKLHFSQVQPTPVEAWERMLASKKEKAALFDGENGIDPATITAVQ
eukprot:TRINITY_DN8470_c1_g1_i1.p1 TRINITY_DN8470_c1_g1~~TRINITY_DN8470_c1_g1_i1.p1  ORF type:complete len:1130 (+),score=237.72 TRINITY_DN8470_c1_g1_i1:154-3543(+)